ncbi:MAG TPA: hypothetical protein VFY99_10665 [Solirubrobacterales bacterium]
MSGRASTAGNVAGALTGIGIITMVLFPLLIPGILITLPFVLPFALLALPAIAIAGLVAAIRAIARRVRAKRPDEASPRRREAGRLSREIAT